jgi:hypothetical protein
MAVPLTLTPGPAGDTALVVDPRCGFSLAIPGHPELRDPETGAGIPVHHARVAVADLGIELRYRLDDLPVPAPKPGLMAAAFAEAYARNRTAQEVQVAPADMTRLGAWGGAALAATLYPLRETDGGRDMEEILIALRAAGPAGTWAVHLTKRFQSAAMSPIDWSSWNSAVTASMLWDPEHPASELPRLFPDSDVLEPGFPLRLKPKWAERVDAMGKELVRYARPEQLADVYKKLARLAGGGEAPTTPVDDERRKIFTDYLGNVAPNDELWDILTAEFKGVATAHDMRGYVLFFHAALRAPYR